jgi:hypothetical protein
MQLQDIRATPTFRAALVAGIGLLLGIAAVLSLVILADQDATIGSDLGQSAEVQEPIHASFEMQFLGPRTTGSELASSSYADTAHAPFEVQFSAWNSAYAVDSTMNPAPAHATFEMQLLASESNAKVDALYGVSPVHATFDMQLLQAVDRSPQE